MSPLIKKVLIAFVIAIVIVGGYMLFFGGSDDAPLASSAAAADSEAAVESQKFLVRLQELQRIKLDGSVLSDPRFASLVNFTQPIVDEPTGRTNPFAPVQ
jgi:hypothetical protein